MGYGGAARTAPPWPESAPRTRSACSCPALVSNCQGACAARCASWSPEVARRFECSPRPRRCRATGHVIEQPRRMPLQTAAATTRLAIQIAPTASGPPTPLHSFRLFRDSAADALTGLKGSTKVRHHHSRAWSPAPPAIARFRDSASPFARSHSRLSSFGRSRAWLNGRRAMATSLVTTLAKSGTLAATAWAVKPLLVRVTSRGLGSGLAL